MNNENLMNIAIEISQGKECSATGLFDNELTSEIVSKMSIVLLGDNVGPALRFLEEAKFLAKIIPEFEAVAKMNSAKNAFKSVWPHTITVVSQAKKDLIIRWSAFFHDFGKAFTYRIIKGKVSFHGHEKYSEKIFNEFSSKWKIFSQEESELISFVISNLGYVEGYESSWSESGVRRFITDTGKNYHYLLDLSRADITTKYDNKRLKILQKIDELEARIKEVIIKDAYIPPLPKGIGNVIMDVCKLQPGKMVAFIKSDMESKAESGLIPSHQDIEYYKTWLEENKDKYAVEK